MSELQAFLTLGFRHITDLAAMDHILFLLALAAIYRARDWRRSLWVISAFTAGHSVTLALAVTGAVALPTALIEFLIPLTIVATCIENLLVRDRARAWWGGRYRPVFAGVFGLVHGAGFANYLRSLFVAPIAIPLFGFNVGIELGQVVVSVRAFADDFRAVAGGVSDSAAFGYLTTVLTLSDRDGRTLPLAWCGARRTGDLVWLCLHAPATRGLAGLRVDARLLFDRFEDQINIVQASYGGRQVSLLFVRGDHPKALP